jgi:hypothetical protein
LGERQVIVSKRRQRPDFPSGFGAHHSDHEEVEMKQVLAISFLLAAFHFSSQTASSQSASAAGLAVSALAAAPQAPQTVPGAAKAIPAAPSNLAVISATDTSVTLTWTLGSNDATTIHIEFQTGSAGFMEIPPGVSGNSTGVLVSNLTPGTPYTFRVRASNADGFSAYSNTVTINAAINAVPALSPLAAAALIVLLALLSMLALRRRTNPTS